MKNKRIILQRMFKFIMDKNISANSEIKDIIFSRKFPGPWPVKRIRAVNFTEQFDINIDDIDSKLWNAYVDRLNKTIGSDYNVWVRNVDGEMVGILAFYDSEGNEIKMKHFVDWNDLYKHTKLNTD